jgi:signal transduction histidine kinase
VSGPLSPIRRRVPRSFQARLTVAFVGVVALTLALIAPVLINRMDDYFRVQERQSLEARRDATARVLVQFIEATTGTEAVLRLDDAGGGALNPRVRRLLEDQDGREGLLTLLANNVAQADIVVRFGVPVPGVDGQTTVRPIPVLVFNAQLRTPAQQRGQARDPEIGIGPEAYPIADTPVDWGMEISLSNPFTSRESTLSAITGLVVVMAGIAFAIAVIVAAVIASRFTTPLRRLTEASRRLAEGDLTSRVPTDEVAANTRELQELSRQFNAMADRLEESVAIIRRDRDRSREFLADVSHELRTPIAALRTFTELLQGPAGEDAAARDEFLESSAAQLERLDWLALNLLELSKLDSGLVLLDLRPEDVRATIESAVDQAEPTAVRRGVALHLDLPGQPVRIRHDPPRVGQIVSNLVGNALKFTPRGGSVHVQVRGEPGGGARLEVQDTGVGIDAAELPRIFERFYRGSGANEARGTGSGLGLAIVKSIVDMHHGSVAVESQVGRGSRFVVSLPRDPREVSDVLPDDGAALLEAISVTSEPKMVESSHTDAPHLNRETAP